MQVADLFAKLGLQVDKKSWSVGNDVIAGLGKALAVFVGYKVVSGIGSMVEEVIALGGHLNDLAQSTGQNVETLQELGYVAKLNSSSTEELGSALGKLSRNMYEAANGGKTQAEAFARLGIKVKDSRGELRASEDVLLDLADRFSTMPDGPKKTAEAMSVLGKSGAALIPTLNNGRENIEKLRQEFKDLGGEIASGDISKLDDLGDDIDKLGSSWQGIKNQVVVALVPVLKGMAEGLLTWVKANRELIKTKLQSVVEGLAKALTFFGKAIAFVVSHWEIFAAALTGVAVVTGIIRLIKFIEFLQLASTAAAAKTAVAWLVAAAPFILIAAAIAALVYAMLKYKKQTKEIFNWIVGQLMKALDWIQSLPGRAVAALTALGELIKQKIGEAWDWVKTKAEETWDYITGIPGRIKDWAKDKVGLGDDSSAPQGVRAPAPIIQGQAGYLVPSKNAGPSVVITNGPMTVQVPAGAKPEEYEAAVRKGVQEEWANQMNHAVADAGEDQ